MKEKEEDEERNDNICRQRTDNQTKNSSKTEATLSPVDRRGTRANYNRLMENKGNYKLLNIKSTFIFISLLIFTFNFI